MAGGPRAKILAIPDSRRCQRRFVLDLSVLGRVLAQSSPRTSAAYGIAHDTEAAGSLALEANLSREFAGSRVKFLRMHRRLPSLSSVRPPSTSLPISLLPLGIYLLVLYLSLSSLPPSLLVLPPRPPLTPSFTLSPLALQCRSSLVVFGRRSIPAASLLPPFLSLLPG